MGRGQGRERSVWWLIKYSITLNVRIISLGCDRALCVALLMGAGRVPVASAQTPDGGSASTAIATDRPAITDSSAVVADRMFQVENGLVDTGNQAHRTLDFTETLIRLGVGPSTELRFTAPDYYRNSITSAGSESGVGDLAGRHQTATAPYIGGVRNSGGLVAQLPYWGQCTLQPWLRSVVPVTLVTPPLVTLDGGRNAFCLCADSKRFTRCYRRVHVPCGPAVVQELGCVYRIRRRCLTSW
jgi:hypothetical protein